MAALCVCVCVCVCVRVHALMRACACALCAMSKNAIFCAMARCKRLGSFLHEDVGVGVPRVGGADVERATWQASITGYEVQQLRHGEWTSVVEAEQLINDQLRRFKRERRHVDTDFEETTRLRKRPVLAFTRDNLAGNTEYKFRIAAKNPGGQAFSPQVEIKTENEEWARRLSAEEDQRLLDLCQSCGCEEYFERLSRALYDAETLSRLPADELREVLDKFQVLPKHREKLRAALSEPPGAPHKLHVKRCDLAFDVLLCSWEPPEACGGSYPVIEYLVQVWCVRALCFFLCCSVITPLLLDEAVCV